MATTTTRKPRAYLNNKSLLEQVIKSKAEGRMTDELAKMLQLLCANLAKKGNFVNYSYNEDMQGYGMMTIVKAWDSFNPDRGSNCFAYYTQILKNAFIQFLKQEQKQRTVRDLMLVDMGMNPSHTFSNSYEYSNNEESRNVDVGSDPDLY